MITNLVSVPVFTAALSQARTPLRRDVGVRRDEAFQTPLTDAISAPRVKAAGRPIFSGLNFDPHQQGERRVPDAIIKRHGRYVFLKGACSCSGIHTYNSPEDAPQAAGLLAGRVRFC